MVKPESRPAINDVLRMADANQASIKALLSSYGMSLGVVSKGEQIPGSFWGEDEAGLIGKQLLVWADTPLHSILHETSHFICMDQQRRDGVHTDAGGDYDEENAVCYLQILLADHIEGFDRKRMFEDMDRWGYTFRLGSAQKWFERDAEDALAWLLRHGLINQQQQPIWRLREN